jgi:putative transposase
MVMLTGPGLPSGPSSISYRNSDSMDSVRARRAYKLRTYPTRPQEGRAVRLLRAHCDLYNAALQARREAWRMQRVSITYIGQCAQLKQIRAADPDGQGRHSCTAQQQTLRRLNVVFQAFYRRVQDADPKQWRRARRKVGSPRFKPYQRFNQVLFIAGDGAKWEPVCSGRWAYASFQAVGRVKVHQHRAIVGRVKTLQLRREGRRWYVIVVTQADPQLLPATGRQVGIDLDVVRFLTTSDGQVIANPRFLEGTQARIASMQRRKERARPGSGNRRRLRRQLAREWRKVANQRRDFHHKTARDLIDAYDVVALEDLRVDSMTATARKTLDVPGRNVVAKSALNRSILDAGWAQFTRILVAKAESAGRRMVFLNPQWRRVTCHACSARCIRPRQDTVVCPDCGEWDADLNGARNIATRAGLGSGQAPAA